MRVLVLGLDCLVPDVLADDDDRMPTVREIGRKGRAGVLRSTLPPITVPAWTSMLTGRDPGELGIYGFRNRRGFGYGDMVLASSAGVRFPRVWDRLGAGGRPSIVVGVPQTSPPRAIDGVLVCGFEGPLRSGGAYTYPADLADEVRQVIGEYIFDIDDFRNAAREGVIETAREMTKRRFALMAHFLRTRPWEFAMLHEIGPDRMHHCFWRYHDPSHPGHLPATRYADVINSYYRFLDAQVAGLLDEVGDDTAVLIVSDHGARAMHGGICVNEILRDAGLLALRAEPIRPTFLTPDLVDWGKTSAWAEGGYYARIFLNLAGREPAGVVSRADRAGLVRHIKELLSTVKLDDGRVLRSQVAQPSELYRKVRGIPPDLLMFSDEHWRSIGSVGMGNIWVSVNDTGADEANHSRDGMYALSAPGLIPARPARPSRMVEASILDITPTLLDLLDLPADPSLAGRSLVAVLTAA